MVYEPSLHFPVAPGGGVEGAVWAAAEDVELLSCLAFWAPVSVLPGAASHWATPPCPLQAPFFDALWVYDPSLQRPVAPAGASSALAAPSAANMKTMTTLESVRKRNICASPSERIVSHSAPASSVAACVLRVLSFPCLTECGRRCSISCSLRLRRPFPPVRVPARAQRKSYRISHTRRKDSCVLTLGKRLWGRTRPLPTQSRGPALCFKPQRNSLRRRLRTWPGTTRRIPLERSPGLPQGRFSRDAATAFRWVPQRDA